MSKERTDEDGKNFPILKKMPYKEPTENLMIENRETKSNYDKKVLTLSFINPFIKPSV